jgi:D-arabinose 1-dehydrogenase-like Zn-dependent alcohol dehydrogenase
VIGVVDAVGDGVAAHRPGDRVGVGWNGGYCGRCGPCRHGDLYACADTQITGISRDGGYADMLVTPASAIARVPAGLAAAEAAPLLCAGITTYNALRHSGARGGDLVAVLGLGGLGHLGVQYAAKMGFRTVAIARGAEKGELAKKLGAEAYIDSKAQDPSAELQKLGGARVVLATVTAGDAMRAALFGLGVGGSLMVLGAPPTLEVSPGWLIGGRRKIEGWASGTAIDAEETLAFSVAHGVKSMNEVFPFSQVNEAFERMKSGEARFRVVLTLP